MDSSWTVTAASPPWCSAPPSSSLRPQSSPSLRTIQFFSSVAFSTDLPLAASVQPLVSTSPRLQLFVGAALSLQPMLSHQTWGKYFFKYLRLDAEDWLLRYLYGILLGSQLPLWMFPWVMVVPCIVFLPLSFFVNDTPLWLVKQVKLSLVTTNILTWERVSNRLCNCLKRDSASQGRNKEAETALAKLRGADYHLQPELKELEALQAISAAEGTSPSFLSLFSRRSFLVPVSILSTLFSLHASVGSDVLSYYSLTLFIFPGVSLSPTVLAVCHQTSFSIGMIISPFIMSRINRRPQFVVGCLVVAIHMVLLGFDNYLELSATQPYLSYLPVILLMSFGISFGLGIGSIPYTLSGELFPHQMRSWGCGTALAFRFRNGLTF